MNTNWDRLKLKSDAKTAFKANYWYCVLAGFIFMAVTASETSASVNDGPQYMIAWAAEHIPAIVLASLFCILARIFVGNPLLCGIAAFFTANRKSPQTAGIILFPFRHGYMNIVKTMFFMNLKIFLWSLLLIVPGIIKAYEYRMIPYLLAENPGISTNEAFAVSKMMMNGNKANAFVLDFSFIPWHLLAAVTLGLAGVFYVMPYICQTDAGLYLAIKGEKPDDSEDIQQIIITGDVDDPSYEIIE